MKKLAMAALVFLAHTGITHSADTPPVEVWMSPYCGCCGGWVEHLRSEGLEVIEHKTEDMASVKESAGVPEQMQSCHTAKVAGYVVEGHVPAAAIRKLLAERPGISGIAVPGMPMNSPGMGSMDGTLKTLTLDGAVFSED